MRTTPLYLVDFDNLPLDEDGRLLPGFVLATRTPVPAEAPFTKDQHVLHAAKGVPPPEGAYIIRDGSTPWNIADLIAEWPNGCKYVLDATWNTTGSMGDYIARGKMVDVPDGVTPIAEYLPSHKWAGELD